jgi:branched-chain amino acid transport system substrate-binding protein
MNHKVGILLPKSVIYPSINFDLVNGLKAGLASKGDNITEVKTENIALGADDKLIYAQCEKLVFEGCSVIAGYINPASAEKLEQLMAQANAVFLCLDAGYHFPSDFTKREHIFYLSLQGALCCSVLATIAAGEGVLNAAYTGSYYESGYRSVFAFHTSLEDSGGAINYNHIGQLKRSEFTLDPLTEHLAKPGTDGVLASYCGDMMEDFFRVAAAQSAFKDHPVYGSSFMGEEEWLAKVPYPGVDVRVCVPWALELDSKENKEFKTALGKRATVFSLLGWEAGIVAATAIKATDAGEATKNLEGLTISSPRGQLMLAADTHHTHAPVYEAWVERDEATGNCKLVPGEASPNTENERIKLDQRIIATVGPYTSWLNTYACLDS